MINQLVATPDSLAQMLGGVLQREMMWVRSAPTRLAMLYGWGEEKSKKVYQGKLSPTAADLVNMLASDDEVFDMVLEMTGRRDALTADKRRAILEILQGEE